MRKNIKTCYKKIKQYNNKANFVDSVTKEHILNVLKSGAF